jgi:hypothetical protein
LNSGTVDPNGFNNPRAPAYVLSGNAGHYDVSSTFSSPPLLLSRSEGGQADDALSFAVLRSKGLDSFDDPVKRANGSVFSNDNTYGWGRLTFIDAENLTYEQIASTNSTVIDTQKLYKKRHGNSSSRKRLERID